MATRVLSGSHYFSDGIAGALLGVMCGILSIKLYGYLNRASQQNISPSLNSDPAIDLKTRPEWKPVIERGQVTYELQVIDNVQSSNRVEISNGIEVSSGVKVSNGISVSGNVQASAIARVSTRP
jgi:hypothetical protein